MKTHLRSIASLLPFMVAARLAAETSAPAPAWRVADLPKIAAPGGLVRFARAEIRSERDDLRQELADLRAGRPQALVELSCTGARLAGASSAAVTGAQLAFHFATLDSRARTERLDTALPRTMAQAPDREFQRAVRAAVRGAVTGNWEVGAAVAGDLSGEAMALAPAALNTTQDAARKIVSVRSGTSLTVRNGDHSDLRCDVAPSVLVTNTDVSMIR